MNLIIAGIQGSGKGTQSVLLAKHIGIHHISFGDAIYKLLSEGNPIAEPYSLELYRNGRLAPDDVLFRVARHVITPEINKQGFILDGFPRTQGQLEFILTHFAIDHVIMLNIPEAVSIERMKQRGRADDTEEGIRNRINAYRTTTEPIFNQFIASGKLLTINANKPIDNVQTEILLKLGAIE